MTKSTSNKPMTPVVGRIYHMFDDGKITYARHNLVRCKQVIKLTDFKKHRMYDAWKEAVSEHDWIFNPELHALSCVNTLTAMIMMSMFHLSYTTQ